MSTDGNGRRRRRLLTALLAIPYRSRPGLIVHEVVGVTLDQAYVLARGVNQETRDRVTSDRLVGVVVAHLETSAVCSVL